MLKASKAHSINVNPRKKAALRERAMSQIEGPPLRGSRRTNTGGQGAAQPSTVLFEARCQSKHTIELEMAGGDTTNSTQHSANLRPKTWVGRSVGLRFALCSALPYYYTVQKRRLLEICLYSPSRSRAAQLGTFRGIRRNLRSHPGRSPKGELRRSSMQQGGRHH